jgi:enoyl-CoA hydratase/carnithine racemase
LEEARRDRSITGCVLTGHGEVFCTGGDYRSAGSSSSDRLEFARAHTDVARATSRLGKPLVAAVNGDAHAGGFSLIALCDLAVCADEATLGLPEAAQGLFPLLALAIVKDSLPQKVFFDLVYRARLLNAGDARALHLVNEVVPRSQVLNRAIELAGSTRHANPDIISIGRDLYYDTRGVPPHDANERARFALMAALKALDEPQA